MKDKTAPLQSLTISVLDFDGPYRLLYWSHLTVNSLRNSNCYWNIPNETSLLKMVSKTARTVERIRTFYALLSCTLQEVDRLQKQNGNTVDLSTILPLKDTDAIQCIFMEY